MKYFVNSHITNLFGDKHSFRTSRKPAKEKDDKVYILWANRWHLVRHDNPCGFGYIKTKAGDFNVSKVEPYDEI